MFAFLSLLLENSFSSFLAENILLSQKFYQKFIFRLNIVNFSMYTKDKTVVACDVSQI